MSKSWSSGADRLATAARAAGFAMATPDDRPTEAPEEAIVKPQNAWSSAHPGRALVVTVHRSAGFQATLRDWMASLNWRAPA